LTDLQIVLIFIGLAVAALLVVPRLIMLRTIPKVIAIFRETGAVGVDNARSHEELGLAPKGVLDRMLRARDHKPRALELLIGADIVQIDSVGKLYLSEAKLAKTRWSHL
jgi:hypothetical protein